MFAPWIPEVLSRIESFTRLTTPPTPLAIEKARVLLVNAPEGNAEPYVSAFPLGNGHGVGIIIKEGRDTTHVFPNGRSFATIID